MYRWRMGLTATCDSSCDVPISEGPVNLTWPAIMKTINEDPQAFYADGGWDFVLGGGDVRYSCHHFGLLDLIYFGRIPRNQLQRKDQSSTIARWMTRSRMLAKNLVQIVRIHLSYSGRRLLISGMRSR